VHHAAISNGRQYRRERKIATQHASTKIALSERYSVTRPEGYVLESTSIFAKRNLIFRAAIEIIENNFRQPPASQRAEILYVNDLWRPNLTCSSIRHRQKRVQAMARGGLFESFAHKVTIFLRFPISDPLLFRTLVRYFKIG
jgi:hypothetical protein